LSNHAHRRPRRLTNAQVWSRIERFIRSGDPRYLPPVLRPEAAAIAAVLAEVAAAAPPWPGPGDEPPAGMPLAEVYRQLAGDELADAEACLPGE